MPTLTNSGVAISNMHTPNTLFSDDDHKKLAAAKMPHTVAIVAMVK